MKLESKKFRLGWIPFWNMHPLRCELEAVLGSRLDWVEGTPNIVNKALATGGVDLAASSSVCLIQSNNVDTALPLGIAARGPVESVYWGLAQPQHAKWVEQIENRIADLRKVFQRTTGTHSFLDPEFAGEFFANASGQKSVFSEIPSLWLTPSSAASAALSRVLYFLVFGKPWSCSGAIEDSDMQLLIGDEALQMAPVFAYRLDLADLWKKITDLPFVFAIWQQSQRVAPALLEKVYSAAILAEEKISSDSKAYLPSGLPKDVAGKPVDLVGYWQKIHYSLDQTDLRSLQLYLSLVRKLEQPGFQGTAWHKGLQQGLLDLNGSVLSGVNP